MVKYWKTTVQDGEKDVNLFVATSDESIAIDLDSESYGSFILQHRASWNGGRNPTEETNHRHLAEAALAHHRDLRHYKHANRSVELVGAIPAGLEPFPMGGHSKRGYQQCAVTVYEQR